MVDRVYMIRTVMASKSSTPLYFFRPTFFYFIFKFLPRIRKGAFNLAEASFAFSVLPADWFRTLSPSGLYSLSPSLSQLVLDGAYLRLSAVKSLSLSLNLKSPSQELTEVAKDEDDSVMGVEVLQRSFTETSSRTTLQEIIV